jgi:hypothetical protein
VIGTPPPSVPPEDLPVEPSMATRMSAHRARRKWRVLQRIRLIGIIALTVAIVAVLVFQVVGVSLLLGYGKSNHDNTSQTKQNTAQIQQAVQILIDCTTPNHPCYEKGQQNTRTAVQGLNAAADARAICAQDTANNTIELLESCMVGKLAAHR